MRMGRAKKIILISVFFISFCMVTLLFSLAIVSLNGEFYKNEFKKYNIYNKFDEKKEEIDNEFILVLDYVKWKEDNLESDFFNQKEKAHLFDVRNLICLFESIFIISLAVMIGCIFLLHRSGEDLMSITAKASLFTLFIAAIIIFFVAFDFTYAFNIMHEILFTNELWKLNPLTDNLIVMLPEQIFFDIGMQWIMNASMVCFFIIVTSSITRFKHHSR